MECKKSKEINEYGSTFYKFLTFVAALISPIAWFVKDRILASSSERASDFYQIPQEYFYDNSVHNFLNIVLTALIFLFILFLPFILIKMSERYKFKITKFDRGMYTVVVLLYTSLLGIMLLFEANITWSSTSNLARFFLILIPITLGVLTFLYLSLYIREVDIKDDNMKDDPEEGYKFITFDFNGGRQCDELKNQVRYQVPIGSKVSDAVDHLKKIHTLKEIKKDGEKFFCWSDNKNWEKQYSDEVITKNYDNERKLYAQYGDKRTQNKLIEMVYIAFAIIALFIFGAACYRIEYSKTDPANKTSYEVVTYGNNDSKVIIGHYNGDAILMDYKEEEANEKEDNDKKRIKLKAGKFYIDSVKGKKIEMEHFKTVKTEKPEDIESTNH